MNNLKQKEMKSERKKGCKKYRKMLVGMKKKRRKKGTSKRKAINV
jgi:hypothetical protein